MGRAKLKLELIPNSRSRRVTFEKRKKGLMKKAEEFKTLCGVDTCVVIYPMGTSGDGLVKPEIWPPDSKEVERIVCRYQSESAHRRAKHVTGLREFFASRNKKIDAELAEARRANWEAKSPVTEELLNDLSDPQVRRSSLSIVNERLKQAKTRLATLKEKKRAKMVAQSDSNVPSVGGDILASNTAFVQYGVVETGLPHEFGVIKTGLPHEVLYQQDKVECRVEEGLPFDFLFEEGLPFEFLFEEDSSVGSNPECPLPLSSSLSEYSTQFGGQFGVVETGLPHEFGVIETGLPHEFLYQQDKVECRVEEGLPFDFLFQEGLPFDFLFEADGSGGSNPECPLPLSSSLSEYSTQFGPSSGDYSWSSTVNEEAQTQNMICDPCSSFFPQNLYHDEAQFFNAPTYFC